MKTLASYHPIQDGVYNNREHTDPHSFCSVPQIVMCVDSRNEKWKCADIRGDHSFLGGGPHSCRGLQRDVSLEAVALPQGRTGDWEGTSRGGFRVWLWDLISFLFQRWSQAAKVVASPDTGFCDPQPGFHLVGAVLRTLWVVDFGVSSALLPGVPPASAVTASAQALVGQAWNILTSLPGPLVPSPIPPLATPPPYCPTFRSCLYPRLPVSGGIPDLLLRFLAT